jgi:Leucine-rich repeat (LRR) protein
MKRLEEWDTSYLNDEDRVIEMKKVHIHNCPNLRIKPHLPRTASWYIVKSDNVLLPRRESVSHIDRLIAGDIDVPLHQWGFLPHLLSLGHLKLESCSDLTISPEISVVFHSLKSLILYQCQAKLEELFGELTSLQELKILDHEKLDEFPNKMRQLTKLQSLELDCCPSLRQLPQWFGELASLKKLVIESCVAIMTLPESIEELTNLQELKISYCNPELKRWCNAEENKTKLAHIERKVCARPYCLSYNYCSCLCTDNVFHVLMYHILFFCSLFLGGFFF